MRVCRLFVAVIFVSCVLSGMGFAQATGVYAFGPFDNHGFDTINRGNLNIHFTIPIFTKPGRGGSNFVYYLNYDGLIWSPTSVSGASIWTPAPEFGWTDTTNADYGYITYQLQIIQCGYTYQGKIKIPEFETVYNNYAYYDNHGNTHKIPYSFSGTCGGTIGTQTGTATYTLTDNSGLTIYRNGGAFVVFTAQGAQYSVPEYMQENTSSPYYTQSSPGSAVFTDTNGNEISASSTGVFSDTMGKTVLTVTGSATNSPMVYTYTDSNGHSQTVTVNYIAYTVQTNFGVSGITEYNESNIPLVSSIVYSADNTSYSFTYEQTPGNPSAVTGRIASVTLRTGGTISYVYTGGNNGIESDGTTAGLTRTTSDGTTQYVRSGISSTASTTTITDAMGNQTKSTFLIDSYGHFYESDQARYAGSVGGTPLLEIQTCYNAAICSSSSVSSVFSLISEYTYQNGTLVNYGYQDYQGPELIQLDSESDTNTTTSYNYTQYSGQDDIPFWRMTSVIAATSGTGSQNYEETTFGYDETTPTTTSGLPQHISVSTTRGNLTSIHQWYNSSGATLTTTLTYDDAGQLLSETAPDGGVTSYTYDSGTDTLPTQVTLPNVNGNRFSASFNFDPNTGLLLSSTDLNSQTTTYSYDGMLRPTQISYPDGGKTTYSYTSTQTSQYRYQNASTYEDTETLYDGYGRVSRVAVANGQSSNPWYQTDTCYNADGEVGFESYRYQGNEWSTPQVCSGAGDAYSYDALGRTLKVTHADNTSVTYAYDATATQVTDENGVSKIINMLDANRIAGVCEISSNSSMPDSGSPASCNMPISGTGFLTTYAYNLPNHEVTVTQGVQTRVFETDWAGRPTYVQEPESGTTTYSYAYNSTGLVVTRERPQANQTNPSVLTTTTTQYDALGRPLTITYSDGVTPNRQFVYDTECCWTPSVTNVKGRLVVMGAETTSGGSHSGALFSYDAMGRITSMWECGPNTCGTGNQNSHALSFSYDWAGNLTSENDGVSGDITYGISQAGEVASIANETYSLTGGAGPATLVSNVQNGPDGPISYYFANGLSQFYAYDSLGRLDSGWVCVGAPSNACPNQRYGFAVYNRKGNEALGVSDDVMGQNIGYGYDEFGRMTSMTNSSGQGLYTYTYDRYGNRWAQTALQGGPSPSVSYDVATNQINSGGYAYDAAGNLSSDGSNTYSYDAEGNLIGVTGSNSATYVYDALNDRVESDINGSIIEYTYDYAGRRVSSWIEPSNAGNEGRIYWGNAEVAFRATTGYTFYEHQDWLGTTRVRTDYQGNDGGLFSSLPFGDGVSKTVYDSYADQDNTHFAMLDLDNETDTDHATYRQYYNTLGSWMSPDPYMGSYDPSNPQSFNRYSYVLNNPLTYVDPEGLMIQVDGGGYEDCGNDPNCTPANDGYDWVDGALDAAAAQSEMEWLGSGSIPWYSVVGSDLMLMYSDPTYWITNPNFNIDDPNNQVYGALIQYPLWIDLGPAATDNSLQVAPTLPGGAFVSHTAVIGFPNNPRMQAPPTPPQTSSWSKYETQVGCEIDQEIAHGDNIVTAYGLSVLAGGLGGYKTAGVFFTVGTSMQLGIRETCVKVAWGSNYF